MSVCELFTGHVDEQEEQMCRNGKCPASGDAVKRLGNAVRQSKARQNDMAWDDIWTV